LTKVQLERILNQRIVSVQVFSGGDIAHAQRVDTDKQSYFVKSGSFANAKELFEKEAAGLLALKKSKTIHTPEIIGIHALDGTSCLILKFIENKPSQPRHMEDFGRQLARLHLSAKTALFGFETDNFIGKLPQSNYKHSDWPTFYVEERLQPQIKLAFEQKLVNPSGISSTERLLHRCKELFGNVSPSLLHGDLWGGNYLISTHGTVHLIDPAVYYGHNEVDLAMSKLFGGFSDAFYGAYHEIIPPHPNQKVLTEIYQLYYLLVHLNLFGTSYLSPTLRILNKYFS